METPFGRLPDHLAAHGSMAEQHDHLQSRLTRRTLLKGAALAGLAAASPALWVQSAAAALKAVRGRHVAFGTDPRHQAVASFAIDQPFRTATVEYGTDDTFGSLCPVDARTVAGVSTVYGHAVLAGLEPGTAYRYRVRVDGTVTGAATLRSAPSTAEPFTFTAFGDQGVSATAKAIVGQLRGVEPRFHLLAGDLCYADSSGSGRPSDVFDPHVWDTWLSMIEPVASSTAWMCATGNHDMEPGYGALGYDGYLNRFVVPATGAAGCPSTYSFQYGNVGVLSLDANDVSYEISHNLNYSRGRQTAWLGEQLTAMRAPGSGVDFVVVVFHHCAFSTSDLHGSEGGIREHWVPLFDQHEVDLVINGHAHLYERTSLLRHGLITAKAARGTEVDSRIGTTYITAGGGGKQVQGGFSTGGSFVVGPGGHKLHESAPWSLPTRTDVHSFLTVRVSPATGAGAPARMHLTCNDRTGATLDEITLLRGPASQPPAADNHSLPWVAGGAAATVAAAGAWALQRRHAAGPAAGPATGHDPGPAAAHDPGPA